jgi:hypothetical protein
MKRYAPVNVCIYCGATEDLRDEHIIPLALNGDWVLPKASCRACEAVTSAFEGKVLRGPLWLPRLALGLRSRRRKSQPTSFTLEVTSKGKEVTRDVPIHSNLPSVVLPIFASPGFLNGSEIAEGVKVEGFYVGHIQRRPEDVVRELGVDKVALQMEYPVVEFARLVAKIGYAYAVAELGLERVLAPLVLPGIRGLSNDIGHWVGTIPEVKDPPKEDLLHIAKIEQKGDFIAVALSLFAIQSTPIYLVLVSMGLRTGVAQQIYSSHHLSRKCFICYSVTNAAFM